MPIFKIKHLSSLRDDKLGLFDIFGSKIYTHSPDFRTLGAPLQKEVDSGDRPVLGFHPRDSSYCLPIS